MIRGDAGWWTDFQLRVNQTELMMILMCETVERFILTKQPAACELSCSDSKAHSCHSLFC